MISCNKILLKMLKLYVFMFRKSIEGSKSNFRVPKQDVFYKLATRKKNKLNNESKLKAPEIYAKRTTLLLDVSLLNHICAKN